MENILIYIYSLFNIENDGKTFNSELLNIKSIYKILNTVTDIEALRNKLNSKDIQKDILKTSSDKTILVTRLHFYGLTDQPKINTIIGLIDTLQSQLTVKPAATKQPAQIAATLVTAKPTPPSPQPTAVIQPAVIQPAVIQPPVIQPAVIQPAVIQPAVIQTPPAVIQTPPAAAIQTPPSPPALLVTTQSTALPPLTIKNVHEQLIDKLISEIDINDDVTKFKIVASAVIGEITRFNYEEDIDINISKGTITSAIDLIKTKLASSSSTINDDIINEIKRKAEEFVTYTYSENGQFDSIDKIIAVEKTVVENAGLDTVEVLQKSKIAGILIKVVALANAEITQIIARGITPQNKQQFEFIFKTKEFKKKKIRNY